MPSKKELDAQTDALLADGLNKMKEREAQEGAALASAGNQLGEAITEQQRRKKAAADAAKVMKSQRKQPIISKNFPTGRPRFKGMRPGR